MGAFCSFSSSRSESGHLSQLPDSILESLNFVACFVLQSFPFNTTSTLCFLICFHFTPPKWPETHTLLKHHCFWAGMIITPELSPLWHWALNPAATKCAPSGQPSVFPGQQRAAALTLAVLLSLLKSGWPDWFGLVFYIPTSLPSSFSL